MVAAGRPVEFDAARKELVCALIRSGCSRRRAADYVGCDESTIRYGLTRDAAFARKYRQAEAAMQVDCIAQIRHASAKSWRAAAWLLERLYPTEFGVKRGKQVGEDRAGEEPAESGDERVAAAFGFARDEMDSGMERVADVCHDASSDAGEASESSAATTPADGASTATDAWSVEEELENLSTRMAPEDLEIGIRVDSMLRGEKPAAHERPPASRATTTREVFTHDVAADDDDDGDGDDDDDEDRPARDRGSRLRRIQRQARKKLYAMLHDAIERRASPARGDDDVKEWFKSSRDKTWDTAIPPERMMQGAMPSDSTLSNPTSPE